MRACNVSGKQRRQARNVMRSQVFEAIEQVHYRFDTRCPQMHAQAITNFRAMLVDELYRDAPSARTLCARDC